MSLGLVMQFTHFECKSRKRHPFHALVLSSFLIYIVKEGRRQEKRQIKVWVDEDLHFLLLFSLMRRDEKTRDKEAKNIMRGAFACSRDNKIQNVKFRAFVDVPREQRR